MMNIYAHVGYARLKLGGIVVNTCITTLSPSMDASIKLAREELLKMWPSLLYQEHGIHVQCSKQIPQDWADIVANNRGDFQ
jgi:hypothetical protein